MHTTVLAKVDEAGHLKAARPTPIAKSPSRAALDRAKGGKKHPALWQAAHEVDACKSKGEAKPRKRNDPTTSCHT